MCGAAHKNFFYRGLSKFCSRGAKVVHARKTKWFPKRNVMLLLNLSGGSEKNTSFLVGAKNNEKQCLFDETSCSSFYLMVPSGRTSPPFQKGHRPRRVFFLTVRLWSWRNRLNAPSRAEKVSGLCTVCMGLPFFLSALSSGKKKSARGSVRVTERWKKNFWSRRRHPKERWMLLPHLWNTVR